jgi:hypothetical protein
VVKPAEVHSHELKRFKRRCSGYVLSPGVPWEESVMRVRLPLLVAVVLLVAGLVLAPVAAVRTDATDAVATRDEPLMVLADGLYASLSDADATAATWCCRWC